MPEQVIINVRGQDRVFEKPDHMSDEEMKAWAHSQPDDPSRPAQPQQPQAPAWQAPVRALTQGATFGFGDEIQGGINATADVLSGNADPTDWLDQYRIRRDQERQGLDQYAKEHPVANMALQTAGGMAIPIGAAGEAASALPQLGRGAMEWGRLARTGAGAGAAYGLGGSRAELTQPTGQGVLGQVGQAAMDTGIGGAAGATLGLGVPWGLQAAGSTLRGVGNMVAPQRTLQIEQGLQLMGQGAANAANVMTSGNQAYMQRVRQLQAAPTGPLSVPGSERARLVGRLDELGYEVTPGVRLNDDQLRNMEAGMRSNYINPIGARLFDVLRGNSQRIASQIRERIGLAPGREISNVDIGRRHTELQTTFNGVGDAIPTFKFDHESRLDMNNLMHDATFTAAPKPAVEAELRRLQTTQDFNGNISGERAMQMRKAWADAASSAWKKGDSALGGMYNGLVDMLDEQISRVAPADVQPVWAQARREYRMITALRMPGVLSETRKGSVNPAAFNSALKRVYKTHYELAKDVDPATGRGDNLFDVVRALTSAGDLVGDSGTATRLSNLNSLGGFHPGAMGALVTSRILSGPVGGAYMRMAPGALRAPGPLAQGASRVGRSLTGPVLQETRYLDDNGNVLPEGEH